MYNYSLMSDDSVDYDNSRTERIDYNIPISDELAEEIIELDTLSCRDASDLDSVAEEEDDLRMGSAADIDRSFLD